LIKKYGANLGFYNLNNSCEETAVRPNLRGETGNMHCLFVIVPNTRLTIVSLVKGEKSHECSSYFATAPRRLCLITRKFLILFSKEEIIKKNLKNYETNFILELGFEPTTLWNLIFSCPLNLFAILMSY
jgi:hypothetical protein